MMNLLNRFAAWLWDVTTSTDHTIDDLTYALTQADYWSRRFNEESTRATRALQTVDELTKQLAGARQGAKSVGTPNKVGRPKRERRPRKGGPAKD